MNKSDFIELVKTSGNYSTKVEAEKAIKAFTDSVTSVLAAKDEVVFVGFGSFSTALQKGKSGTVPGTTKTYKTEDKIVPRFKSGVTLKNACAGIK